MGSPKSLLSCVILPCLPLPLGSRLHSSSTCTIKARVTFFPGSMKDSRVSSQSSVGLGLGLSVSSEQSIWKLKNQYWSQHSSMYSTSHLLSADCVPGIRDKVDKIPAIMNNDSDS